MSGRSFNNPRSEPRPSPEVAPMPYTGLHHQPTQWEALHVPAVAPRETHDKRKEEKVGDKSNEVWIGGATGPPKELSDYDIEKIHSGLLIPNEKAIHSMSREIRKWRGEKDPDSV